MKDLNPEVIGVVNLGHPQAEAGIVVYPLLVHLVHVKGWIGHHEVKLAQALMDILVVGVALPDISGQPMHCQVHLA